MKKKIVIVSGYFNPIHKGHIEYFYLAKKLADILIVIVNNDFQREIKGSTLFMLEDERKIIVEQLKVVDKVFLSIDKDKSVSKTIEKIYSIYSKDYDLFFANGCDQNNKSIPESNICKHLGVDLVDGLGDKIQSSSWLIKKK